MYFVFFFFSSRRRHTRYIGDWSSDVCSSDLAADAAHLVSAARAHGYLPDQVLRRVAIELQRAGDLFGPFDGRITNADLLAMRSEERRVGKECRAVWVRWGCGKRRCCVEHMGG